MGQRHLAREAALGFLYQADLSLEASILNPEKHASHFFGSEPMAELYNRLCYGVQQDRDSLDEKIQSCSEHWKIARMERVDRVILRIAAWELLNEPETPSKVVIDEAVELAKKFSTTESASFVNGVLDQFARRFAPKEASEVEKSFELQAKASKS